MSATTDEPASDRAAKSAEMPGGAMTDAGEPPPATGEMPSGAMTGEVGGEMPGAGYSIGGIGSTTGEMPSGSMTDTAPDTPGMAAGAGEMPGDTFGTSAGIAGEMPAGVVGGETDAASAAIEGTGGEMPGEGAGAVTASPPTVEINAGPWRMRISPS